MKNKEMKILSDLDAAYLAGLIDGEGHLSLFHKKMSYSQGRQWSFVITINITSLSCIRWLSTTIGGNVVLIHTKGPHATCWKWSVSCREARHVLRTIRPYLKIKAAEADIALQFIELIQPRGGKRIRRDPMTEALKAELAQKIKDQRAANKFWI